MSRTIEQIQSGIIKDMQAQPELAEMNSTSRRSIWRLFAFVQAGAIMLLEEIIEVFKAENEEKISKAIPATPSWLSAKVFEFQFSDINPQIIQLRDLAPVYDVIDSSLRIISRCSVVTTISNQVVIKVAKNEPPVALSQNELSSLQSYINTIGIAGVNYGVISSPSDKIYIDAEIYYNGQYSTVIQSTVTNAINVFLANLPFNGQLKVSDIEMAVRSVKGVNDILINDVRVRSNSETVGSGTFLVQNKTVISRLFPTISGYITPETSTGLKLSESLTFIAN